ncbi:large ribosomal subunit protein eL22A [Trichomonascus vanleenenianus]|uniref:60S ribosomal protein eL22 RPL22A n=1 Tax=Trichomonascus vanleenenianus TaxID=2268995 RepID=UPI003ECBA980
MAPVKTKKSQKIAKKFVVDVSANAENDIIDVTALEKFFNENIKVEGKVGQLGDLVQVSRSGNRITIASYTKFSGKYVKYLTKRFLKKNNLRDWLRVVASSRNVYELRFFNLVLSDEEEEEEDEE